MDSISVMAIPAVILFVDVSGSRVIASNPAAERAWGYSSTQLKELPLADLLAGDEVDVDAAVSGAVVNGGVTGFSADVLAAGGRRCRYRFLAQPTGGIGGSVALAGMAADANADTRSLETDARRLRALIESNFDAYYDWHITQGFHEWSPQMDELLGLEPGVFPNTLEAWVERLHPSEREAVTAKLHASVEQGGPYRDEYLLRREDGEYRFVSDRGVLLFDEEQRPSDLVGVIRDITQERAARSALEESEELYRTLFRATNNPALRTDAEGRCIDANEAALSFLGTGSDDLLQTTIADHFGVRALETLHELSLAPASDREAVTVELTATNDEDERTLVVSVIPSPVAGRLTYFWLGTEVTRLRRLNAELEESQNSLQAQARALEEHSVALRVILDQGRQERLDLERAIQDNIDRLVAPMLDRLQRFLADRPEASYVDAVRNTLTEIARPFGSPESNGDATLQTSLTRKEMEVARLVEMDKSTDEIASILHLSPSTVSYHRKRIRRKLGLNSRKIRLARYLFELRREPPTQQTAAMPTDSPRLAKPPFGHGLLDVERP